MVLVMCNTERCAQCNVISWYTYFHIFTVKWFCTANQMQFLISLFIMKWLLCLNVSEFARCLPGATLTIHSILPHQTATEEVTALCQPPSPTTRPMTATPGAPITALTEAAAVPPVRGLGHKGKQDLLERQRL